MSTYKITGGFYNADVDTSYDNQHYHCFPVGTIVKLDKDQDDDEADSAFFSTDKGVTQIVSWKHVEGM